MNVRLHLVQAWARAAVPAGLKTASKFAEEAEPITQVQIHVYEIALHQIGISRRGASQIKMAEIFAAIAQEDAEGNVVVLVVTAKRYVLQVVQEFGPAIRIAEVPV